MYCYKFINGFWIADKAFCSSANIDHMTLFIDNNEGHLIVDKDGILIENTPLLINKQPSIDTDLLNPNLTNLSLTIEPKQSTECVLSGSYQMSISPIDGHLIIYDGEKIYAELYKDHITSSKL